MAGYSNRAWACPFFVWDDKQKIHCEGGTVKFRDPQELGDYADQFCANVDGWDRCSVAACLMRRYESEEAT